MQYKGLTLRSTYIQTRSTIARTLSLQLASGIVTHLTSSPIHFLHVPTQTLKPGTLSPDPRRSHPSLVHYSSLDSSSYAADPAHYPPGQPAACDPPADPAALTPSIHISTPAPLASAAGPGRLPPLPRGLSATWLLQLLSGTLCTRELPRVLLRRVYTVPVLCKDRGGEGAVQDRVRA